MRRTVIFCSLVLAPGLLSVSPASTGQESPQLAYVCAGEGRVTASHLPRVVDLDECDLVGRVVTAGGVGVVVPRPGRMAAAVAVGDATEGELVVITGFDGTVRVTERHSARSRAQEARSGGPAPCEARFDCLPACDDRAYATYAPENPKVRRSQPWYFKASSTPGSLNRRKVERRVKKGAQNIPAAENDCGMSDPVKKGAPYKGRTRKAATSIRSTVCNPRHGDGRSVVDFGSLPRGVLGFTCFVAATSSPNGRFYIREADVRLRKGGPWTLRPSSPSCRRRFDLMGVVTHERGHAFGLAHPRYDKKQTHAQLTMHSAAFPCSPYIRTLGLGDVRGLNFLY